MTNGHISEHDKSTMNLTDNPEGWGLPKKQKRNEKRRKNFYRDSLQKQTLMRRVEMTNI